VKILLGIYTGDVVLESALANVLSLQASMISRGIQDPVSSYIQRTSCRVDANRNYIMHYFLNKSTADYLFIIDQDVSHPADAPYVLASRDKPIVCGLYFKRNEAGIHHPMFYKNIGTGVEDRQGYKIGEFCEDNYSPNPFIPIVAEFLHNSKAPLIDDPFLLAKEDGSLPMTGGIIEIDASGFGCVMIRRDVIEAMSPPYLIDEPHLNGDLVFYRNAKKLGFDIWGDMSVVCSHRQVKPIGLKGFQDFVWKEVNEYNASRTQEIRTEIY